MNIKKYLNPKTIFIGANSFNDLKIKDHITISDNLSPNELDNLEYLKNNIYITIEANYITKNDELNYYSNIKKIIDRLKKYRKTYNINIEVNNRELLRQSFLLQTIPNNINLTIINNKCSYNLNEYLSEEKKLESLVKPIREANLSPLEKYLAVYNIVKSFKPYKENEQDKRQSRELKYILMDDNEYIVCVGFARLLLELLNRIDIPCKYIHVDVDDSYEQKYNDTIKNVNHIGHARNLIKIDDDKYNIHGIYLSDSTFDSKKSQNIYLHSLLTFDRLKEAKNLEKLNDIDLLLDFHNLEEFKKKLEYYLKKENKLLKENNDDSLDLTRRTYKNLYLKIVDIIKLIDEPFFIKIYNKYNNDLCDNIKDVDLNILNEIISRFTTEYYRFIMPLTNNEIELTTILTAVAYAQKSISNIPNEKLNAWIRKLIDDSKSAQETMFPYIYDPNNDKEAYLETRKSKK